MKALEVDHIKRDRVNEAARSRAAEAAHDLRKKAGKGKRATNVSRFGSFFSLGVGGFDWRIFFFFFFLVCGIGGFVFIFLLFRLPSRL